MRTALEVRQRPVPSALPPAVVEHFVWAVRVPGVRVAKRRFVSFSCSSGYEPMFLGSKLHRFLRQCPERREFGEKRPYPLPC